jgi:hypothetical protein
MDAIEMETVSGWRLRQRAGLSYEQLQMYVDAGLFPTADEGWPDADEDRLVDRLVEIQKAKADARSLPRRAVRLWRFDLNLPVAKLREAMIAVARSMSAPKKKQGRIMQALGVLNEPLFASPTPQRRRRVQRGKQPQPQRWPEILRRFPEDDDFEQIARSMYSQARSLAVYPKIVNSDILSGIPFEEIFVVLMVAQLAVGDTSGASDVAD